MKKHFFFLCAALVCAGCLAALEIESGKLDPAMAAVVSKPEASGGAAVRLLAPRGTKVPVADIKNLPGPAVKLEISVDKPGMYAVRLRAFTFNDGSNSAWCTVDGGKAIPFWFRTADVGKWAEQPAAETVQLTPGKHELAFYVRENGILLDKAEVVFKGAPPRRTIRLTGPSPYRFTTDGGEYEFCSVCKSESRDIHLYGTFSFDGGTPYRRVVFAASGRKSRWERLMYITLPHGEHTLDVKLPENVTLTHFLLKPVDRNVPLPPAMAAYKPPFSPVKGEHPRVLMRRSDLERIRANFRTPENAPVWDMVRKRAKQNPAMPVRHGRVAYDYRYLTILNAKAFVCAVEGDETAGREAVRAITEYMAKIDFDNVQDVTRKIGHTIYIAALIYDWCCPLLSDTDKTVLRQAMIRLGRDQEIGWPPLRQSVITGHGDESQLSRDFLAMAIAVYDEDPEPWKICLYRILEEMVPGHNFDLASGRHLQGTNYGPCRFRWELHAQMTLERISGKRIFSKDIEKVPFYWINMMLPNYDLFDEGDVWMVKGVPFTYPETFFNMYVVTGDPLVKAEFLRQGGAGWAMHDPIFFLIFNRPEIVPDADYAKLPLTWQAVEPLPELVARSSWVFGKKSPSAVVEMKGAQYHRRDHQHMDAGAFQVFFRAPLLADIGQYGHYGGHYDYHFAKRTIAHNCMLFYEPDEKFAMPGNDGGQRIGAWAGTIEKVLAQLDKSRTGRTLAVSIGPDRQLPLYSHLKSDLAAAYSAHKLAAYTRSFVYANTGDPAKPAILIVFDRAKTTKAEFQKFFVLNSPVRPEISGDLFTYRNRLKDGPEGVAVVTSLLPEKKTVECKSDGKAMEFFREKVEAPPKNRQLSKGSRTMISPAVPALEDEFLHVVEVGTPEAVRPTAKFTRDGNRLYVTAANWLVGFAQVPDDRAVFRVKDARNVLLTDLKPGTYTAAKDGKAWQSFEVKEGEGTLFFPAEPGEYKIAPGSDAPKADYSGLKAVVPSFREQITLSGKPLAIKPVRHGFLRYWPVEPACRALGGEAAVSGNNAMLKFPAGTFAVQAGSAEAKDGKFVVRLPGEAAVLNGKLCLPDESLAALAGYALRSDEENVFRLRKLPDGIVGVATSGKGDNSVFAPLAPESEADYWGIAGPDHAYTVYFDKERTLAGLDAAWFRGATRRAKFAAETSPDGVKFAQVWKGESSGKSEELEPVKFSPVRCRAVRLRLFGNSENDWNSIRRLQFHFEK